MTAKLIMLPPSLASPSEGAGLREMEEPAAAEYMFGRGMPAASPERTPVAPGRKSASSVRRVSSANHNSEDGWLDCGKEGGREGHRGGKQNPQKPRCWQASLRHKQM